MTYHLHHLGKDLGTATLEDLRRRRQTGELTGAELVWCAGMSDWRPLDETLASLAVAAEPGPPALAAPAAAPAGRRGSSRALYWVVGSLVLLVLLAAGGIAILYNTVRKQVSELVPTSPATVTQPLLVATNAVTEWDVRRRGRLFRERQWLEGYEERGQRDHPADAQGVRLIREWIEMNFGERTNATTVTPASLAELAGKVARTVGMGDPLLLTVAAQTVTSAEEKRDLLERALRGFPDSKHRAYPRLNAAITLLASYNYAAEHRELFQVAGDALRECLQDGSIRPDDQPEIAETLVHGWASDWFNRGRPIVIGMVGSAGPDFGWLQHVLAGEHFHSEAWRIRGSGFANSVSEQGWKGFADNLAAARTNFTAAWQARPDWPLAAAAMVKVSMGDQGVDEMRRWFDRAVQAQVDHREAWNSMRWGLRPRWFGDPDSMLAFGRRAVETRRFDTDVPRKFFDSVRDVEEELKIPAGEHLYGREDIWPQMKTLYEGYISEPAQARWADGWRSSYGVVAYFAGHYDTARAQLEKLNWQPYEGNLSEWGRELSLMTVEVAARTGPLAAEVTEAESAFARGDVGQAIRLYEAIQARSEADERTLKFAGHRLATLRLEEKFQAGNWVPLLPTSTNDPAWVNLAGTVRVGADGVVSVESERWGHQIACRARLGNAWEVRGEIEVETPSENSGRPVGAGIAFGLPTWDAGHWYSFRLTREADGPAQARFSRNWRRGQYLELTAPATFKDGWNTFAFRFRDHRAEATVNGTTIFSGLEAKPGMRTLVNNHQLALTAEEKPGSLLVKYRKVEVRKQ